MLRMLLRWACKLLWFIRSRWLRFLKKPLQRSAEAQPTKSHTHTPRLAKQNLTFHPRFALLRQWWKHWWHGAHRPTGPMIYVIFEQGWGRVSWRHKEPGPQESLRKVVKKKKKLRFVERCHSCKDFISLDTQKSFMVSPESWERLMKIHCCSFSDNYLLN